MPDGLVISIDAMGGDQAPAMVIEGVEIAARRLEGVRYRLHGAPAQLEPLLAASPTARAACELAPAEKIIAMDAKPSQALRQGRGSSLWNALADVEQGRANAAVSAGNTGALMAMAKLRLRTMEGVHRPALAGLWPTPKGFAVLLDVGANLEADAEQLVEFAIMGEAFHRALYGLARPRVGLLNIGTEELKGHEEIRAAARLIREAGVDIDFAGFVEGDGISKGAADVIVTDGFTGNIALKTGEGTARLVTHFLREALRSTPLAMLGALLAAPALKKLRDRLDPSSVNGGVFLGLNGAVVKSHGGADARGFAAAIDMGARMARSHFREEIEQNLARLSAAAKRVVAPVETNPS